MSYFKQERDSLRENVEAIEAAVKLCEGADGGGEVGEVLWEGFAQILTAFDSKAVDEATLSIAKKLYDRANSELSAKETFMLALSSVDQCSKYGIKPKVEVSKMLTRSVQGIERKVDRFFVDGVE
eukprot:CAMPEP_0204841780 /NCGR_PEP_ID=MMETSP1346-20131115/43600_1 /ASSEMBLY_ACC=CAM_ASM_000771 /TAXON_ID=215587 /ORGANISM="Aplanochytrium stocchinoi, Strain GSBS06" /LENGTH=124 /DNA_ID=CAMNT_0051980177 /DNA_START=134 /DNA_END=505 /DNA_ORIENTATION=+